MSIWKYRTVFFWYFAGLTLLLSWGCSNGTKDKPTVDWDTETESDTDNGTDTGSDHDTASDSITESGSDSSSVTDSGTGTGDDTGVDTATDTESGLDSDTSDDTESGSDSDTGVDTAECTPETVEADCGAGKVCTPKGECCSTPCDGGCQTCSAEGQDGTCVTMEANEVCRPLGGPCDIIERCDGESIECPEDKVQYLTVCRESVDAECDKADRCDGKEKACPDDVVMDEGFECGDTITNTDCDKPDSCDGKGYCSNNWLPNNSLCGDMNGTAAFRCSTDDCDANAQSRVVGEACQDGVCVNDLDPPWQDIDDCTENQICQSSATGSSCVDCSEVPDDACDGDTRIYWDMDAGVCDIQGGKRICLYAPTEEPCENSYNCVLGVCTPYTCEPGEKEGTFDWNDKKAQEWTIGANWGFKDNYPWPSPTTTTGFNSYLQFPAVQNGTLSTDEADNYIVSPVYEFFACTSGEATFHFLSTYQATPCGGAKIVLECGYEDTWVEVWNEPQGTQYENPSSKTEAEYTVTVDIRPCFGMTDVQFRIGAVNYCSSIQNYWIDNFSFTAVQDPE